ncbi:MAG: hypothetical protein KDD84_10560 [Caldilineaceae bacterium]|nr:hypothetical protein [Caldilineaceae bacterium]
MQDNYQASNYHAMQPEQSGIIGTLRNHALSGLAAIALGATAVMGAKDASAQEQVASLNIQGTNLAQFGVPDLNGRNPIRRTQIDTNGDGYNESVLELYENGAGLVGVFSMDGVPYAVALDSNRQTPVDRVLYDFNGRQQYTEVPVDFDIVPPEN